MTERKTLSLNVPLSLEKQAQLFQQLGTLPPSLKLPEAQAQHQKELKDLKKQKIKETISWLSHQFPKCFNLEAPKPLKTHIEKDIFLKITPPETLSKNLIREALAYYSNNIQYKKALQHYSQRFDLEGMPIETIPNEHKKHAAKQLESLKAYANTKSKRKVIKRTFQAPLKDE
jgi:sRNA-binding protein